MTLDGSKGIARRLIAVDGVVDDSDVLRPEQLDDIAIRVLPDRIECDRDADRPIGIVHPGKNDGARARGGWPVNIIADQAQAVSVLDDMDHRLPVGRQSLTVNDVMLDRDAGN